MTLRARMACLLAAVSAVALTVLRLCHAPLAAILGTVLLAVLAVFLLCGLRPRPSMQVRGGFSVFSAVAAAFTGAGLLVSGYDIAMGLLAGVYPYPQPITVDVLGQLLLFGWLAGALAGGVIMLISAVRWLQNRCTVRVPITLLCLGPVVWTWGRLLWYMTSFISAANRFRSLIEVAFLLCEMFFLLYMARYVSGVGDKPSRVAFPLSVVTAFLGLTACATRLGATLLQTADTFADAALITAPDFGMVLLAVSVVLGYLFGEPAPVLSVEPAEEEPTPVEEDEVQEEQEEGEEVAFLLEDLLAEPVVDSEEEDVIPEEERRPLELEDIINEILNRQS